MREHFIKALSEILNDNMGNRLTPAVGTGIINLLNNHCAELEAQNAKSITQAQIDGLNKLEAKDTAEGGK